jgi:uncharacterized damage-inducible protein DinB
MIDLRLAPGDDPREDSGSRDERGILEDYLRNYRLTIAVKCAGLTPEQLAARAVPPSSMSLLGLVRHLVGVEHYWFRHVLSGDTSQPRPFRTPEDHDADFNAAVGTQECVDEAFTAWQAEVDNAELALAAAPSLEVTSRDRHGETVVLRDLLVHMIEEYARHAGHADLLRECVDGATGD